MDEGTGGSVEDGEGSSIDGGGGFSLADGAAGGVLPKLISMSARVNLSDDASQHAMPPLSSGRFLSQQ